MYYVLSILMYSLFYIVNLLSAVIDEETEM